MFCPHTANLPLSSVHKVTHSQLNLLTEEDFVLCSLSVAIHIESDYILRKVIMLYIEYLVLSVKPTNIILKESKIKNFISEFVFFFCLFVFYFLPF